MSSLLAAKRKFLEEEKYVSSKKAKDNEKNKKHKKHKHKKDKKQKKKSKKNHKKSASESSSSSDSEESDEWVEKPTAETPKQISEPAPRDEWMSMMGSFKTFTRDESKVEDKKETKQHIDSYDPAKCNRELNPYWRDGGKGLPAENKSKSSHTNNFKRPIQDERSSRDYKNYSQMNSYSNKGWKKKSDVAKDDYCEKQQTEYKSNTHKIDTDEMPQISPDYLSDEEMNKLGAKIVKAEIMGNTELLAKLNTKLQKARDYKKQNPGVVPSTSKRDGAVMLTVTDSKGNTRPLVKNQHAGDHRSKGGKKKAETHSASGERVRFFADDDKYSLKEMFEKEKYETTDDSKEEFLNAISKHKNPNDDLEDIFSEKITKNKSDAKIDKRNMDKAISQHKSMQRSVENCDYCLDSERMNKKMIGSLGSLVYVALPERISLVENHCIISTITHMPCSTAIDEDVWNEIMVYRRALTSMFSSRNEDVIFFETASYLHKYPHMVIHCIPLPRDVGDMSSIYFKKALLECETEWSNNKKVIDLKGRDVRKGVPKGLPYFWVDFGMDPGFAHVIEDQHLFPKNFAQEIVGGMLDLNHSLWRKPHKENFEVQRRKVLSFQKIWKLFDPKEKL